ncbi:MAG: folylpolyglutamate synthase/dihydrofolate synthase family protein [Cardiobacteriaceae bacterium]|nr:folylpolyglutamate synthase/dihydrofolate synthase family protein [Cardiobacteriaceae bacterium]
MSTEAPRGCGDLASWLAWQESAHAKAWDLGLGRIGAVWQALGAPRIAGHIITVAGTNGKGSTVAFTEALCIAHGVPVASLTSPHLLDYRERIRFDGQKADAADLCAAFDAIDAARGDISLTYFEWNALAAFWLMARRRPQIAVLEVGLGGRLDAVNLIDADAVIFTRIGLDHTDWLGDSVEKIAREKGGVLRNGQAVAFADAHPAPVLLEMAHAQARAVWRFGEDLHVTEKADALDVAVPGFHRSIAAPPRMPGRHQHGHLAAALAVLGQWVALRAQAVEDAMRAVHVTGRLMPLSRDGDWLIDVAHNADSAEVLAAHLQTLRDRYRRIVILCGMLRDKDRQAVFRTLDALADIWVLAGLPGERGSTVAELAAQAQAAGVDNHKLHLCATVHDALQEIEKIKKTGDLQVVMGSFVTVSQVLEHFNHD